MSYNHKQYELRRRFCRFLLRTIGFTLLVKVDRVSGLENIPTYGPAILMINHIAFVDPMIVLQVIPHRNLVPMAKVEVFDYPVIGIFPRLYHVIPVRREEVDRRAIQSALEVLEAGEMILIAPESTRSPALQTAKPGVAYLATRSHAPVIPVAIEGTIGYPTFRGSKRWHGPGITIQFGRPFRFQTANTGRVRTETLNLMTTEAMYALAALLPPERRGVYADLSQASQDTLEFL
jgi:1-acyl-sn-glycerol-3-phosphate acyltransferase